MKVKDVIEKLKEYNQDAKVSVIAHCHKHEFSLSFGSGVEGETKEDCSEVSFYVDELCTNERQKL